MSAKQNSAETNPAVRQCMDAWYEAYDAASDEGQETKECQGAAALAYCEAMPPLF